MTTDKKKSSLDEATLVKNPDELARARGDDSAAKRFPIVEIASGPGQGKRFFVDLQKETTIGRSALNTIVLEDNSVSRSHAVIFSKEGQVILKDLGSRNGTLVNKKKIGETGVLKHTDLIKVGIYTLRFLTEETFELIEEEVEKPVSVPPPQQTPKPSVPEEKVVQERVSPPVALEKNLPSNEQKIVLQLKGDSAKNSNKVAYLVIGFVVLAAAGLGGNWAYKRFVAQKIPLPEPQKLPPPQQPVAETKPTAPQTPETLVAETSPATQPAETRPTPQQPVAETKPVPTNPPTNGVPVVLEVRAQPLEAKIIFQGKELGITPFSKSVLVALGAPQELTAIYRFEELNQEFAEKKIFTPTKADEVVKVNLAGSIGTLKMKSLPKGVDVYLEGTFATNQLKTQAVKLTEINFKRPIALPYGKYILELKKPERMEGTETVVDVVKYRREFLINKDSLSYEVSLGQQDVEVFPAKITTKPDGAQVLIDGKPVGKPTPFEGTLPLGKHTLVVKKEGYNDYTEELNVGMNVPLTKEITLQTTEAGRLMNKGRDLFRQGQYKQAIDSYLEALKKTPTLEELGEINIALGNCYLKTGAYEMALGYFEKAKANPAFAGRATYGVAETSFTSGNTGLALAKVVELILSEKDERVKADAERLFRKISPLKSVLFITTEPSGAKLIFDRKEIAQPTPVLLSELPVGEHTISVSKPGYKPFDTKISVGVSVFKPVIVKLEKEP